MGGPWGCHTRACGLKVCFTHMFMLPKNNQNEANGSSLYKFQIYIKWGQVCDTEKGGALIWSWGLLCCGWLWLLLVVTCDLCAAVCLDV